MPEDVCLIGMGGNLGDVRAAIASAVAAFADDSASRVVAVSSLVRTRPMGASAGQDFLNAALRLETAQPPEILLAKCHAIEAAHARRRNRHWGPRSLDLDLLTHGEAVSDDSTLRLPHPGCWWRRFVLDPVVEIAPEIVHPTAGESFSTLRDRLLPRPLPIAFDFDLSAAWQAALLERLGPLAAEIILEKPRSEVALHFVQIPATNNPETRQHALPESPEAALDAAEAILVAALDSPRPT